MRFVVALMLWLSLPSLSRAQSYERPALQPVDPSYLAYQNQLHARLTWLQQQEYQLRESDDFRTYRRRHIMGVVFGAVGAASMFLGFVAWAIVRGSNEDGNSDNPILAGAVLGSLTAGTIAGVAFAIEGKVDDPTRDELRAIRLEQRDVRRALKSTRLSLTGLRVTF